ncbi:MAG: class I SAM-dependent methyltransferase [Oscillospiraceae bacterium]|nr:class I SAM-dependent methyltransferase [Oscillospiraceae bacterium]
MEEFEKTFDNIAEEYDRIRPMYVKELFKDLFAYSPINSESRVLEIGMGTGKASGAILDSGCHLVGLEPGIHLAEAASKKYQKYPNLSIVNSTFQNFSCCSEYFDLIYAATAFHWIPEEYGYRRVYELLKQGGAFARFAYHAGTDKKRKELTAEIQKCYRKYASWEDEAKEYSEEYAKNLAETARKYGYVDIKHKMYYFNKDFTADEYMGLLRTYPDHMKIEDASRRKLFQGIHSAIVNNGGVITVYYTMDLELARKM